MRTFLQQMFSAPGDMSLSTLTSNVFNVNDSVIYAIQAIFTGSPVGTLKLQASLDYQPGIFPNNAPAFAGNWTDVGSSSTAVSGAGNVMWNTEEIGYIWVRLVYTKTSGTGSLTALINCKGPS